MKKQKSINYSIIKSKHFVNMVFSIMAVSVFVMLIISLIIYYRFINKQRNNSILNAKSSVYNFESTISDRLLDMKQLSIKASRDPNFSYYPNTDDENLIVSQLKNYSSANGFYDCIGFRRSSEKNIIYSSLGCFENDEFNNYMYLFNNVEQLKNNIFIMFDEGISKKPENLNEQIFKFSDKLDDGGSANTKIIEFYVAKSKFDDITQSIIGKSSTRVMIFDENNDLIYKKGKTNNALLKLS